MKKSINIDNVTVNVFENAESGSEYVANLIQQKIDKNNRSYTSTVLGLATGSTPKKLYEKLIKAHQENGLSFSRVTTFNLDEYYPISRFDESSYHTFMDRQLFSKVDIDPERTFIPDGEIAKEEVAAYCEAYEDEIKKAGGIDLQLLGVGTNGHIGFNEPGTSIDTRTRLIDLHEITREGAKDDFGGIENVPKEAITVGIETILDSKEIVCMAWGKHKAEAIAAFMKGEITTENPVSYLRTHPNVKLVLDKDAASLIEDY